MKDILDLKNKYKGESCFVLGNGPSLTKEKIDKLRDKITIGCNGIVYAKQIWDFEPTFILSTDTGIFGPKYFKAFKESDSTLVFSKFMKYKVMSNNIKLSDENKKLFEKVYEVRFTNPVIIQNNILYEVKRIQNVNDLSFDFVEGTFVCGSVIQDLSIPLAAWLGCNPIYLIGCDCDTNGHFYNEPSSPDHSSSLVINQYKYFRRKLFMMGVKIYNLNPEEQSCPGIVKRNLDDVI